MPSLALKPRVGCCCLQEKYFFLDIDRNRYCALPARLNGSIRNVIEGSEIDYDQAQALTSTGLFRSTEAGGMSYPSGCITPPSVSRTGSPKLAKKFQQFRLVMTATAMLSLFHLVVRVIPLKCSLSMCANRTETSRNQAKADNVEMVLGSFRRASLLFVRRNKCLPDAMALKAMLAFYGMPTKIVFGIKLEPFQAHCWVQRDNQVLGQDIFAVSAFHPILALP